MAESAKRELFDLRSEVQLLREVSESSESNIKDALTGKEEVVSQLAKVMKVCIIVYSHFIFCTWPAHAVKQRERNVYSKAARHAHTKNDKTSHVQGHAKFKYPHHGNFGELMNCTCMPACTNCCMRTCTSFPQICEELQKERKSLAQQLLDLQDQLMSQERKMSDERGQRQQAEAETRQAVAVAGSRARSVVTPTTSW